MTKYTVTCETTRYEQCSIQAESEKQAIELVELNPDIYDWEEVGEYTNTYTAEEE